MDAVLASTIDILEDVVKLPDWQSELAFTEPRHTEPLKGIPSIDGAWRLKERIKTVSVALVLCLNVGVDPPDVVKLEPYAHLESWFDPLSEEPQKAIEYISIQLEKQYEQLHSRARYKKCLDPTVDEVKRLCTSLRRYSKEDRVLFHYNGHGVPRPTPNGEIWVFNEKYTQYIPLAIFDLQRWLGTPAIYVFDCSSAGSIVESYLESAKHHKRDYEMQLIKYTAQQQAQQQIVLDNTNVVEAGQQGRSANNLLHQQSTKLRSTLNTNEVSQQQQHQRATTTTATTNGTGPANNNNNNNNSTATAKDNDKNNPDSIETQQQPQMNIYKGPPIKPPDYESCFHLAACEANQLLPMQPDLPADLFTSCLTTPIKMALRWFIQKNNFRLMPGITLDLVDKIPGSIVDRKSMFGELNWIFTAVTDTIAWDVLPRQVFQRLYRQDLLVASLFRNFLLADRIMRTYDCTPVSHPKLPKTYHHPMWRAWDMVVDLCLTQLIDVVEDRAPFKTSSFFAEQLTAFEVWLDLDHSSNQQTDHQLLPILLQVILSPVHRLRALDLLNRFLNLGPSAVHSALSVGIFPYVLKLLQSDAREVRPYLLSIWSKILAIDRQCQVDLVRDKCHRYFLNMLSDTSYDSHYRTKAAFVISCIIRDYPLGQEVAYQANLISHCLEQLDDHDPMLRKWLAICLGLFWDNYEDARWYGVRSCAHEKLYSLLDDPDPEVRAATVFALGTFVNCYSERTDHANTIDHSIGMKLVSTTLFDSSFLVRRELVVALQYLVLAFESQFQKLEQLAREEERKMNDNGTPPSLSSIRGYNSGFLSPTMQANRSASKNLRNYQDPSQHHQQHHHHHHHHNQATCSVNLTPAVNLIPRVNSLNAIPLVFGPGAKIVNNVYHIIWKAMYTLAADPHAQIATSAQIVIDEIRSRSFSGLSIESLKESKSISSISEGSSPNTGGTFSISESPPSTTTTTTNASRRSNIHMDPQNSTIHFTNNTTTTTASSNTTNHQQDNNNRSTSHQNQQYQQQVNNRNNHSPPTIGAGMGQPIPTTTTTSSSSASASAIGINNRGGSTRYAPSNRDNATNLSEDDSRSNFSSHKPLITTDFVDWCGRYFVDADNNYGNGLNAGSSDSNSRRNRLMNDNHNIGANSSDSSVNNGNGLTSTSGGTNTNNGGAMSFSSSNNNREDQQREWRMLRVMSYRNVCLRELQVLDPSRFNESVINYKISQLPQLMIAHPYDPILVFAGKHEFSIMHLDGTHANNYKNNNSLDSSSYSINGDQYNNHHHSHGNNHGHHLSYGGLNLSSSSTVGLLANVVAGATNITNHHNHHNYHHVTNGLNNHHNSNGNNNNNNNNNSIQISHFNNNNGHHQSNSSSHNISAGNTSGTNGTGDFHMNDLIGTQQTCSNIANSSQITSLQLINPQYNTLICTGNSDGSVRIWRAYNGIDYSFNPQLISAYNLMPELLPNRQGLGMILLWDQNQTKFYVTSDQNDIRIIKVWDANSESKVQDIPTCAEFGVSCLSSDSEHCIAAGFLDGSIRIYDTRLKKTDCRVSTFRKHSEKILGLHMFKPGDKHINLISGDSSGEVRFWDKRAPTSVKRLDVGSKMNVMTVHQNADVFACGLSKGQGIKIYNLDGSSRAGCVIKCQEGGNFFTSRHNPDVSSLTFHPLKPSLIAGYSDAVISVYSTR